MLESTPYSDVRSVDWQRVTETFHRSIDSVQEQVLRTRSRQERHPSNLSKANNSRDYRIFEEFANHMVRVAQKKRIKDIFKLHGKVYAFDSTTIDLCLSVYDWAHFRRAKGGIKVHTLFDLEAQVPTDVLRPTLTISLFLMSASQ